MLKGLITVKDIQKKIQYPHAAKDSQGRLRVGAALGVGRDTFERAEALIAEDVDVLVVDTSHGHSRMVIDSVAKLIGSALAAECSSSRATWRPPRPPRR